MFKRIIPANIFLFLFFASFSQRATFNKQEITVGDRVVLRLEISESAGKKIMFPNFEKELVKGLEIINVSDIKKDKTKKLLTQNFVLTAFTDSLFLVKGIPFIVDGDTLFTNPLRLKVSYFKPDSAFMSKIDTSQILKTADIKSPIKTPFTFKEFIQRFGIYALIFFVVLILTYIIVKYLKKRKNNTKIVTKKTETKKIPAHEKALEKLNVLKEKGLHKQDNLKPFYTELSTIIRTYLEERFDFSALESVTSEIIDEFKNTKYGNTANAEHLKELLTLSDTVKFAKNKPDEHENEIMIEYAINFVEKTKEKKETEQENTQNEN